jgi:amino acid adenylation domain-containing protein
MASGIVSAGTIHDAFRAQVRQVPDRPAVVSEAGDLTYAELDRRSTEVASALIGRGFRPGDIGLLLADRSPHVIAGLLGVLKAGGAYLPLDVAYPRQRIERILHASTPAAVLASGATLPDGLDDIVGERSILRIDEVRGAAASPPDEPAGSADLAYVIYTSGSTGEPKGAMNEHRAVLNLVRGLRETVLAGEDGPLRIALVASLAFDASVQQLFSALLLGHTLCIVPEGARRDPWQLVDFYRRFQVDVSDGTPTHLQMLCQVRDTGAALPVRHYVIGGEALSPEVVRDFRSRWCRPGTRITNIYGVAECCVDSCSYLVDDAEVQALGFVPIGAALRGVELSVRDEGLRPLPAGQMGELCISGAGVGPGYLRDDVRTVERFVVHPEHPDRRLYRTGDLARQLADGNLQHCGRMDRQVKLRGHRMELEEIEAALLRYRERSSLDESARVSGAVRRCERCLLDSAHADVSIEDGICSVCRLYERSRDVLDEYFGTEGDFLSLVERCRARQPGDADCLLLFSGGKDSSYALYRLMDMGLRVITFTFDNGYISDTAFENIERITSELGVEHVTGRVGAMPAVFAESLRNESTVCTGCFRGLTAVSTQLAQDRRIPIVVTGLSRGQIVDTKVRPLLQAGITDVAEIDRRLVTHRKLYHARGDRTSQLLNVQLRIDAIDEMHFVDHFRYDPVTTAEIRNYLYMRSSFWREPKDTGLCSTNCRINEVGIHVHGLQRGYHNYAAPLSWDIRLGVQSRDEGLKELGGVVDEEAVRVILQEIGYEPARETRVVRDSAVVVRRQGDGEPRLCAYYTADRPISPEVLRSWLRTALPEFMVPAQYVRLDAIPVSVSGKTDYEALVALPDERLSPEPEGRAAALSPTDRRVLDLWADALELPVNEISPDEDFFALGGSSLTATVLVGLLARDLEVQLSVVEAFANPTVRGMAAAVDACLASTPGRSAAAQTTVLLRGDPAASNAVFLCPDVAGGVENYIPLARRLEAAGAVWGITSGSAREPDGPIEEVAAAVVSAVRSVRPHGPYLLGGWSFGGIVALEAAAQFERMGEEVSLLLLLDAPAPERRRWSDLQARTLASLNSHFGQNAADLVTLWVRAAHRVVPDDALSLELLLRQLPTDLLDDGLRTSMKPDAASIRLVGRMLDRVQALAGYALDGAVRCPIVYLAGRESPVSTVHSDAWQRLTGSSFRRLLVDGGHTSMMREPHVAGVAAAIGAILTADVK